MDGKHHFTTINEYLDPDTSYRARYGIWRGLSL